MKISKIIKNYRTERKISLREFARKAGISSSYLSLIESDETKSPTFETLCKIANGMSININKLVDMMDDDTIVYVKPKPAQSTKIPVLGKVIAGIPIEAIEDVLDYEEISEQMASKGDFFALQIKGDSMEPRMVEGDVVIVRKQEQVVSGEIAIVLVNGDEATVKRVRMLENGIMLIPFNTKYTPWEYDAKQCAELPVQIIGKVVELRGKF